MHYLADKLSGEVPMALDAGDPEVLSIEDSDTMEVQTLPITDQTVKEASLNTELQGVWMNKLDDSITSKVRARLTRQQKHDNFQRHKEVPSEIATLTDVSLEQLKNL